MGGVPDVARWSPDGRFLTIGVGPSIPCCRADSLPFYAIPASGGPAVSLDLALPDTRDTQTWAVSWAPEASFVVLSTGLGSRETYVEKQLVRFDPATGSRINLSTDPSWADIEPAVSPDGSEIAFTRGAAETREGQVAGTPPPGISSGNGNIQAIASRRVWLMQADGTDARQLTGAPGWVDEQPAWTPDGQWIVFVRWRAGDSGSTATAELWAVRTDGSDAQRIVDDLDLPSMFNDSFGFYGRFDWQRLFAVAQ